MAEPYRILVTKYMPIEKEGKTAVVPVSDIYTGKQNKLGIIGALDYEVFNLGTKAVLIFEHVPVAPGASWSPTKSNPYPFAQDVKIAWEGTFKATKIVAYADTGTPRT